MKVLAYDFDPPAGGEKIVAAKPLPPSFRASAQKVGVLNVVATQPFMQKFLYLNHDAKKS